MTDPEQVSVNVADLRLLHALMRDAGCRATGCVLRLIAAIPEHEWEPTDDMRAKYRRAMSITSSLAQSVDLNLRALHREGLL